jgi:tetratricopeptide (TPR) repeat protein/TolB-like protein
MKSVRRRFPICLLTIICLMLSSVPGLAQTDLNVGLDTLAARIVTVMDENAGPDQTTEKIRIAVLDFPDLQGNVTSLGRFVAEELTTRLFLTKRFEVIERQLLNKVLDELKLGATGFVDSSSAQEIGNILGVSAIVSGTLSELSSTVRVNARVIATTTGMIVAAASAELPKDDGVTQLLNTLVTPMSGFIPEPSLVPPVVPGETNAGVDPGARQGESLSIQREQTDRDRIEQALIKRDYYQALSLCREALAANPDFAFAQAALGYSYLQLQPPNREQALIALERAVGLSSYPFGDGFAYYLLGRLYGSLGRRTEVRLALEQAVLRYRGVGPGRVVEPWYDQAVTMCLELYQEEIKACWERDDYYQALSLSQQLIAAFNPAFAYTAQGYSLLMLDSKQAPAAIKSLLTAVQLDGKKTGDGWNYYLLGWAYQESGETEKAQEALEQAVISSRQVLALTRPAWYNDCLVRLQTGYDQKVRQLLADRDYRAAIEFLEVALDFVPGYAYGYVVLGYSYLMTGNNSDQAIEALEAAHHLEAEPADGGWSYYLLGWAYQENQRYGSAVEAFGKALQRGEGLGTAAETNDWVPACRTRLTESYEQLFGGFLSRGGNYSYYLTLAEQSIELVPEFATGLAMKGYCLIELSPHRSTEALEYLQQAQAIKEDPTGDGWIFYALGRVYQEKGDKQTALTYLDQALRRGEEAKLSHGNYWYRRCNSMFEELSKQRRVMFGFVTNRDSQTEDPYLMVKIGSEKGRPFDSFTGLKWRLGASPETWWAEVGGELAWEGELLPPTKSIGWYATLGGGIFGAYYLPDPSSYLDYGFYFSFGSGLRVYLGETNRYCLTIGSEYRSYPQDVRAIELGVSLGLPSRQE